jgi:hypothetical protein
MQSEEHDAIEWFHREQLAGLRFADPSYLGLLQGLSVADHQVSPGAVSSPPALKKFNL